MSVRTKQRLCCVGLVLVALALWYQISAAQSVAYQACVDAGVQSNETCAYYTR